MDTHTNVHDSTSDFGLRLVSIRFDRRNLFFAPVLLSLVVVVLMTYTGRKISGDSLIIPTGYQLGYYLVYLFVVIFLFAFLLNEATKKGQTTG